MAGKAHGPFPAAVELYPDIRQSLLSDFDDCALSALFSMKFGKGWGTHPQNRGTIAHATIAECLRTMKRQGENEIPVSEALEILYEQLEQADVPDDEVVRVPLRQLSELRMAIIKWAHDNTFTTKHIVGIEDRLWAPITYDTPAGQVERGLTGQPDVLIADPENDGAIIIDWKDTWALPSESAEGENAISYGGYFQQRFYGYLVLKTFPAIQQVTLREFYIRRTKARAATIHRGNLDHIERELSVLVKQFDRAVQQGFDRRKTKIWGPSPGHHCGWCLMPGRCPIENEARGAGAITSEAMAKRYADEFVVADAVRKHRREALRAYLDPRSGSIELKRAKGRSALGFEQRIVTPRPTQEQIESAVANGINPRTLFKPKVQTQFRKFTPEDSDRGPDSGDEYAFETEEGETLNLADAAKASAKRASEKPPKVKA